MEGRHNGGGGKVGRLVLLALGLVLAAPGAALADPPAISANPGNENQISGEDFTPNSSVAVSIFTSQGGSLLFSGSFPTDGSGHFSFPELEDGGVQLPVGRYISAADGGPLGTKALTVVPLSFDALNPATDTASGTASANAIVDVEVFEDANQFNGQATANGNGAWSLSLAPFDVRRGGGTASIFDNDGDSTAANGQVPGFSASPSSDRIKACCAGPPFALAQTGTAGGRFTASSSVTMRIFSAANVQLFSGSVATGSRGGFDVGASTPQGEPV